MRLFAILLLTFGSLGSRAESLYLPMPVYIERQVTQSSTVYLEVDGQQHDLPVEALARSSDRELERIRQFLNAVALGNAAPLGNEVGAAFSKNPDGVEGYLRRFKSNWSRLSDQRLLVSLRFAGLEMFVFSASFQQQRIFPTVYFRRSEGGKWVLIPDEASDSFQILALWAATLRTTGLNVLNAREAQNVLVRLAAPEAQGSPRASGSSAVLWTRRGHESTPQRAEPVFRQFGRWVQEAARLSAPNQAPLAASAFFAAALSEESARYTASMPEAERQRFLNTMAESAAVGFLDLGKAVAILVRHGPSDGVHIAYVVGAPGAARLTNLGKVSPIDSFLLNGRFIPRVTLR